MGDFADGFDDATVGPDRIYFPPGFVGVVEVVSLTAEKKRKGNFFIGQFKIVESNLPERPAGSKASYVVGLHHDAAHGNIKRLLAALNNIQLTDKLRLAQLTGDVLRFAVSEDQPMKGVQAKLTTSGTTTKEKGTDFTVHSWEGMKPQPILTPEMAAAEAAAKAAEAAKAAG